MNLEQRIKAFIELGRKLHLQDDFPEIIDRAIVENAWFTQDNIKFSLNSIASEMLNEDKLRNWMSNYSVNHNEVKLEVALILAGNIPAVGFHDILCVLIIGYKAQIKLSSKDKILITFILNELIKIEPRFQEYVEFVERVKDFDGIIATGSNNTAVHFAHYFSKYPNIIRKNRKSIAVISEDFKREDLMALSEDIFRHFGLGCRNVSKLYIHESIDLTKLMEVFHESKEIILHNKYKNNYDYNYTLLLMNGSKFLMNGAMLLVQDENLHSRIATVNYESYGNMNSLKEKIQNNIEEIQCIVSKENLNGLDIIEPGKAQNPGLMDYADHVDTLDFLMNMQR